MTLKKNCLFFLLSIFVIFCYVNSQKVNVTIFTESQCPFCTRLLREQVWQFYTQRPGIMNLQVLIFFNKFIYLF